MKITQLQTELFHNPLGLGESSPRVSWRLETPRAGAKQVAFRLYVGANENALAPHDWLVSDATTFIEIPGAPFESRQRVFWRVEVEDETGEKTLSEVAFFEMGLLEKLDWSARWIGTPLRGDKEIGAAVPKLRRVFALPEDEKIRSARLYASALGVYETFLNGQKIGDLELAPGWTDYHHRVRYHTFDVTSLLQNENEWSVLLGDGWYCGCVEWRGRERYGVAPRFLGQLEIETESGKRLVFNSDESWEWATGPILNADLLQGQHEDARQNWGEWSPVETFQVSENLRLTAPIGPPVRVLETLEPQNVQTLGTDEESVRIFDFGQNLVGRTRLQIRGESGQKLRLRYAETLQGGPIALEGPIYTENLRSAKQTDTFICSGEDDVFEPRFTFHGFRFVEILGLKDGQNVELTAFVMSSDNPKTGDFECSEPLLNQLQKNIHWGWLGNSLDLPTDCPQRDERLGWTGDAQVFIGTSAFIRGVSGFWREWARSVADAQNPENGAIPCVVPDTQILNDGAGPHGGASGDGGPAWADAAIICPWTNYRIYGNTRVLEENYGVFERFVGYLEGSSRDYIRCYDDCGYFKGFGDWLALDGSGKTEGGTHYDLIGTAFFAHSSRLLSQIAEVLGKQDDARKYEALFQKVKAAFVHRYVTREGLLSPSFQTPYLLALHFDLLPEKLRPNAAKELVREVGRRGGHLATGFVGTIYLAPVLSQTGHLSTAYELLHQEKWPSWLYAVTQGATTIWERWNGWTHDQGFADKGMNSFNHYAYGAIGEWLYNTVAGIALDEKIPGYKRFRLAPQPGGKLTHAKAHLDTLHGRIESEWKIADGKLEYRFVVPPNTSARVELPDGSGFEAEAGEFSGSCEM